MIPNYNHLDYIWADNAYEILYPRVVKFFEKVESGMIN